MRPASTASAAAAAVQPEQVKQRTASGGGNGNESSSNSESEEFIPSSRRAGGGGGGAEVRRWRTIALIACCLTLAACSALGWQWMQCQPASTHIVHSNSLTSPAASAAAAGVGVAVSELEPAASVDPPYDSPAEAAAVSAWKAANPPDENDWEATTPEFFPPHPFQRHCKVPPSLTVRERHPLLFDIELRDVLQRPVRTVYSAASLFAVLIEGSEESTRRVRWRCYPTPSRLLGSSVHHVRCPTPPVPGKYTIRTRLVAINATKAQCEHNASPLFCKFNLECKRCSKLFPITNTRAPL